ncbi:MAG: ABC transporter permease [Victivallales bacterium]|nr:ABC transporter permease [Victivallales bacterium]
MNTPTAQFLPPDRIVFAGDWLRGQKHPTCKAILDEHPPKDGVRLEAPQLGQWDSTLPLVLLGLVVAYRKAGHSLDYRQLPEGLVKLLDLCLASQRKAATATVDAEQLSIIHQAGYFGLRLSKAIGDIANFIGELVLAMGRLIAGKSQMRFRDFHGKLLISGPRALPIIALISFLMGIILAFIGAIPLKWFQAEIYVASLVGIGMLRLMGPVMVGIVMAGRSSSAFAAELGTMQVNEELDAMRTLGIPLMDFLVMPRFLAMSLMMPLLGIFADLISILGGLVVAVVYLRLTPLSYISTLTQTTSIKDLLVGLFTCSVLGILDSICGCYQGLHCGRDAEAVGRATTSAVISCIICIVIAVSLITILTVVLAI